MTDNDHSQSWEKYQSYVIKKLDGHDQKLGDVQDHLVKIQVEIATLKVKASLWGAFAGIIPIAIAIVLFFSTNT